MQFLSYLPNLPRVVVLCIGTDRCPGAPPLLFAAKDARNMASFYQGVYGRAATVRCLTNPTGAQLRAELRRIRSERPDLFLLCNSGHGSPTGMQLADGEFGYRELARWMEHVSARHSLVMLDVCHAGAYLEKSGQLGDVIVGGEAFDLISLIAEATPGGRVICSTGASRNSFEGLGVTNGCWTAAWLAAASQLTSSLGFGGPLDDATLFYGAAEIAEARWGQQAIAYGLTGDLPLARALDQPVGSAMFIESTMSGGGGVRASALAFGRQHLPTMLSGTLVNRAGRALATLEHLEVPTDPIQPLTHTFIVPSAIAARDALTSRDLRARGMTELAWQLAVCDLRGRVMRTHESRFTWAPVGSLRQPAWR